MQQNNLSAPQTVFVTLFSFPQCILKIDSSAKWTVTNQSVKKKVKLAHFLFINSVGNLTEMDAASGLSRQLSFKNKLIISLDNRAVWLPIKTNLAHSCL